MAAAFVSVAACLLVVAGAAKVVRPEPASDALAVLGLSVPLLLVRLGAALEIVIAVAALIVSGPIPSALVGASYLGFAGFVALLRRNPDAGSCGCFGAAEEPPSLRHVIVNVLIGVGCLVAGLSSSPSTASLLREDWPRGLLFVAFSVIAAWLVGLVLRSTQLVASMMAALLGAFSLAVVLLVVVVVDLLRSHGRVLRALHEVDPPAVQPPALSQDAEPTES